MAAALLEGRQISEKIKAAIAGELTGLKAKYKGVPRLVSLQIGSDSSSEVYVRSQKKAAEELGIDFEQRSFKEDAAACGIEEAIVALNSDPAVTGVILQLPVPGQIDGKRIAGLISPHKDAEGMHPQNLGRIISGRYAIGPCTAMAVMELLKSVRVDLYGREAVVVGHSEIVGKPISLMLMDKFATTTVCHIATSQKGLLAGHVKRAEILVSAAGKAGLIKGDWIKSGAVVIDVGINRVGDKIVGDVEFETAAERASFITPVPGGVGPLTTAMLMRNTLELFKRQCNMQSGR